MKKILSLLAGVALALGFAHAQVSSNYWKLQGTTLSPLSSSWTVNTGSGGATSTFGFITATTTTATSTFAGNVQVSGNLHVLGNFYAPVSITSAGNIIPSTDLTYNLGSVNSKWSQLFVGTTTVNSTLTVGTTSQSTAKMEINNQDPNRVDGELRIISGSSFGADYDIRIDSPNPDIELIESDQATPAGKYEIAVQGDVFQVNSRNSADNSFETMLQVVRQSSVPADLFIMNASSSSATQNTLTLNNTLSTSGGAQGLAWKNSAISLTMARLSAQAGSSGADSFFKIEVANPAKTLTEYARITTNGYFGIGTSTPLTQFQVTATGTNSTTTVTIGKGGQSKGTCLELYDQAGTVRYAFIGAGATAFTITGTSCK